MSLLRLVYYSAMISAWAAFAGWMISEWITFAATSIMTTSPGALHTIAGYLIVALTAGILGAAIGMGLTVLGGVANGRWRELARRVLPGLACGCVGGVAGGMVGEVMFYAGGSRAIGWMVFGLGVGCAEGIYERSIPKIRNGLIGGAVGGLIGGLLFDLVYNLQLTASGRASRAAAFVVLGLFIGAAIGLAHVIFRAAWLTVVDGYRTGRQLNLTQDLTVLGRGDHVPLVFLGPMNRDLEAEHVLIRRMADGSYRLEDNRTRLGTRLNSQPVSTAAPLADGDVIRLGANLVRFNQRRRRRGEVVAVDAACQAAVLPPLPPAPPPAKSSADKVFSPEPRPWIGTKKP